MKSNLPSRKVGVSALAAALTTVILYLIPKDEPPTPGVEAAIVTIVTFALGYLVPPSANDLAATDDSQGTGGGDE